MAPDTSSHNSGLALAAGYWIMVAASIFCGLFGLWSTRAWFYQRLPHALARDTLTGNSVLALVAQHWTLETATMSYVLLGICFVSAWCYQPVRRIRAGKVNPGPQQDCQRADFMDLLDEKLAVAAVWNARALDAAYFGDKELLKTGFLSDTTILCGAREWKVHSNILASRSKWFRTALLGPFREAKTKVIDLSYLKPDAIVVVLNWIYIQLDIYLGLGNMYDPDYRGTLMIMCHTWEAARYLMLDDLRVKVEELFEEQLRFNLDKICYSDERGQQREKWLHDVIDAAKHVYESDIEILRKHIVSTMLSEDMKPMQIPAIQILVDDIPKLRDDLLMGFNGYLTKLKAERR
ncbi:hypothetical protein F5Y18DRAFT_431432 [Xylariaceae sp. FL1019]|nr:hypothetical protein F5Y18DRAFT_431432 [Xylariaceae sp. FL1019]